MITATSRIGALTGVMLALAAGVLAGCGTSSTRKLASGINLVLGDLPPGFTVQQDTDLPSEPGLVAQVRRCIGHVARSHDLLKVKSPTFSFGRLGVELVQSSVAIERSRKVAARDLARAGHDPAATCLVETVAGATFSTPGGVDMTIAGSQTQPLSVAAPSDDGHTGLRWTALLTAGKLRVPMYVDFLGYVVGRDELSLLTFGIERPFPASLEQQLAALIVDRALRRQGRAAPAAGPSSRA